MYRTVAFPANGRLRLKNFSGDVRIVGTNRRDVSVKARRRAARPQLDHIKLDIQTSGSTVTIDANKRDEQWEREDHNNNVVETTFEIEVPASATLDVDAFSSDVIIENVEGEQQLKTFSGEITVKGARRDVEAETFSADIRMDLGANARGTVRFSTLSGELDAPISMPSGSCSRKKRMRWSGRRWMRGSTSSIRRMFTPRAGRSGSWARR